MILNKYQAPAPLATTWNTAHSPVKGGIGQGLKSSPQPHSENHTPGEEQQPHRGRGTFSYSHKGPIGASDGHATLPCIEENKHQEVGHEAHEYRSGLWAVNLAR